MQPGAGPRRTYPQPRVGSNPAYVGERLEVACTFIVWYQTCWTRVAEIACVPGCRLLCLVEELGEGQSLLVCLLNIIERTVVGKPKHRGDEPVSHLSAQALECPAASVPVLNEPANLYWFAPFYRLSQFFGRLRNS